MRLVVKAFKLNSQYFGINRRCTEKHLKKITTTVHCTKLIFTERTHRELDDYFSPFFFQNLLQVLSSSIAIISSHVYLIRAFRGNGFYPDLQSKLKSRKTGLSFWASWGLFSRVLSICIASSLWKNILGQNIIKQWGGKKYLVTDKHSA